MNKINSKDELDNFFCLHWEEINRYIDKQQELYPPPIYASVDIREGLSKYAPVDHNLFPAGFNNICTLDLNAISLKFKRIFDLKKPRPQSIAILSESHTKNTFYLDHLAILGKVIRDAGFDVFFISFDKNLFKESQSLNLISHSKFDLCLEKAAVCNGKAVIAEDMRPIDLILLNNDQSAPIEILEKEIKTPIMPHPQMGWFNRKKHVYFNYYKKVADEFCRHFAINPNLIQAKYKSVDELDFSSKKGLGHLAKNVDLVLKEIPAGKSVFVKADQGTYGMGISVVSKGEDILQMNRKKRNKMDIGKNKIKFTSALIQETVGTVVKYDNMPAEIAIYLIAGESLGGFMRANPQKSEDANLNSRGMVFKKFCISEIRKNQEHQKKEIVYSIIARLSNLASSCEIKDMIKKEKICKVAERMS